MGGRTWGSEDATQDELIDVDIMRNKEKLY